MEFVVVECWNIIMKLATVNRTRGAEGDEREFGGKVLLMQAGRGIIGCKYKLVSRIYRFS